MLLRLLLSVGIVLSASSSVAQEIGPILDLRQLGRDTLVSNIPRNQLEKPNAADGKAQVPVGKSEADAALRAAQTCANIDAARRRMGAQHPSVLQLERLCRRAGYRLD